MVANNGRYYLMGNYDKYDNVAHFRVDKMTDVRILDEKAKTMPNAPQVANCRMSAIPATKSKRACPNGQAL